MTSLQIKPNWMISHIRDTLAAAAATTLNEAGNPQRKSVFSHTQAHIEERATRLARVANTYSHQTRMTFTPAPERERLRLIAGP